MVQGVNTFKLMNGNKKAMLFKKFVCEGMFYSGSCSSGPPCQRPFV